MTGIFLHFMVKVSNNFTLPSSLAHHGLTVGRPFAPLLAMPAMELKLIMLMHIFRDAARQSRSSIITACPSLSTRHMAATQPWVLWRAAPILGGRPG